MVKHRTSASLTGGPAGPTSTAAAPAPPGFIRFGAQLAPVAAPKHPELVPNGSREDKAES